jgi:4-hydroxy-2-oxoheptanedioate aldolase
MNNILKQKLQNNQSVLGCFVGIDSPAIVEILGISGFDFVIIDSEHGSFSPRNIEDMVKAAELGNITPIVRVGYDPADIQRALDCGAHGIHIPMVNTIEDAKKVINRAKFPPLGNRGTAYSVRAAKYGAEKGRKYLDQANKETFVAVHIETQQAVSNIEEIMSVIGVDMCFIGPTDLSVSMGYAEEGPSHPEVQKAINHVIKIGKQAGVYVGIYAGSTQEFRTTYEKGIPYAAIAITSIISKALKEIVDGSLVKQFRYKFTNENNR